MNIGIFTNNYLPNPYGVTGSIESFRRELEKRGHSVYIFAPRYKEYKDKNSRVFRYPSLDINIKFRFPLAIPHSWKMRKILKNLNLDIIHSQHPNLLGAAAAQWARRKKIPLIFTWHTLYDQYTNFVPFLPKKFVADYMIKKAVKYANRADAVITPTESIISIIKKWGVKNNNIIPIATGVEEEDFKNADRNIIRRKYNIAEDEILLLLISRLTEEKNIKFVFEAVKDILKNNNKIKFLVAGGGYLITKLKNLCEEEKITDKVFFSGEVKREEIKNYYAAGDIFVYGSKSETQGMIITEAMYMGLPIVAVDATGIKSLVLNNSNGFLVSEDEEEFTNAILKLVNDKDLRNKFSENSAHIARMKFTASVCAERMLEVYKECLNH